MRPHGGKKGSIATIALNLEGKGLNSVFIVASALPAWGQHSGGPLHYVRRGLRPPSGIARPTSPVAAGSSFKPLC